MADDVDELASDLRAAVGRLVRRTREVDELPPGRLALLGLLAREGPLTPTELAARRRVRQQSASRSIAALAADGLVATAPDPTDGRRVQVEITQRGHTALLADLSRRASALAVAIEAGLAPEERRTLAAAVPLLDRLAEQAPGHADAPRDDPDAVAAGVAIDAGDAAALAGHLDARPELLAARLGPNRNDLLGFAAATGDPTLVRLVLDRGADPATTNRRGWTALHAAAYGDHPAAAELLLERGAPVDPSGWGDGGTPLVAALFWGHRRVAELLAARSTAPGNLRVAAGLGDLQAIERLVPTPGRALPTAGAHRAFVRPHGGFPAWTPTDDPRELLDEALTWAARADRSDAVALLVARGADLEADTYRGTPLGWAAAFGRAHAVERLLALGAAPDGRTSFGGTGHGEGATPLMLAAQGGRTEVVDALLAAGADLTARDALHDGTPADWAGVGGHPELAARLRAA